MGVKFEDKVWFQIIEEEKTQTESQTSDVIVYKIFGYEDKTLPYSLTIIDTPGYGDTRGTEHDVIISQRLMLLLQSNDGVQEVHAVGLVMKFGSNQLSDQLQYVFNSLTSVFGEGLEKNTVALITHSNGRTPKKDLQSLDAAKIKSAKNANNQPLYFLFDNCQHEDRAEEEDEILKQNYQRSEKGMKAFIDFLQNTASLRPKATPEELKEGIRLTACIQNLQDRIKFTEVKEREMKQNQEALKKQDNMQNEEFTPFVTEVFKHKEPIREEMCRPGFKTALSCTICEENCHYPGCTMALTHCEIFIDGRCTSCTGKCPKSEHVEEKWRYVTRIRKIKKNEKNQTESGNKTNLLENLEKQIKNLTAEKKQLLDESYQHVVKLEPIALKADSVSTFFHLDFLIKKMKEKGDTEKVQKLEEMRSRMDNAKEALLYKNCLFSSTYEDIILTSFLIRSGPPAVYQLRPKKEKIGTLTRIIVGEKNPNKTNRTILLVGETGAGKSTLINALLNYTMGVKFEDEVWFKIVEEDKGRTKGQMKVQMEGQAEGQMKGQTEGQMKGQAEGQMKGQAEGQMKCQAEGQMKGQMEGQAEGQMEGQAEGQMKGQMEGQMKGQAEGQMEGQAESQTESQTSDVIVYEIFGFEDEALPYSLTIIDTPGFGDTRGIEHDDIISERLLDLFRSDDGVNELHAVGLMMKASDNRLSDRLKYSFDAVMSLFGKNMEKNIVALITHSDGMQPENALKALEDAKIKCARNEKNQPLYFLFNNHQHKDRPDENKMIKDSWDFTRKNMDHLTVFLGKSKPQKLMKTVEVLNERIRLKACIQNLQERIEFIELKHREITQIREALENQEALQKQQEQNIQDILKSQEAQKTQGAQKSQELEKIQETLKKHEKEMNNNKNFTVEIDEVYKDKEPIDGGMWRVVFFEGAVCCTVCEENCHYPGCTMAWYPKDCEVMKKGRCTVCTKKCPVSTHVKEKWRYVTKTRRVQKTNEEMKKKYETNKSESQLKRTEVESLKKEINKLEKDDSLLNKSEMQQNYEKNKKESERKKSLLENLEKEMEQLTAERSKLLDESYQHVVRLEQIALKADSVSTVAHLGFLIEKIEKEERDTVMVQKLKMRSRVDEGSRPALGYVWNKLTAFGKRSLRTCEGDEHKY
ncbi:uncharacterized protein LOC115776314 [Archocentrus centrarchus]|uniref:uncharacterized protein LOC115776314 n=1 Tax=Archocentrus centrarchus TaxID=63155 RepID=UPI0011E9E81C|nr:uncharacterized protein LOC115776314 [Archocentrus centrarchus]